MRPSPSSSTAVVLVILLSWAPLPFASVTPGFRLLLTLGVLAALLCAVRSKDLSSAAGGARWGIASLLLLGSWSLLQSLAIPRQWVVRLSPRSADLSQQVADRLALESPTWHLSLAPTNSSDTGLWLLSLAAAGLAASVAASHRNHRRWILASILVSGLFQALYGARRWTAGAVEIWGVAVPGAADRLRGTFVNSDHLALYLELCIAVCTAWLLWSFQRWSRIETLEQRIQTIAPPTLCWFSLFFCLAFTGSRAGLAAGLVATAVQGALIGTHRRYRRWLPVGAVLGGVGVAGVGILGIEAGLGRWLATSSYELTWSVRRAVYSSLWDLIAEFPLTGFGMGAFRVTFPRVQPSAARGTWTHAHNDWLELIASAGWVVTVSFCICLALFIYRMLSASSRGERSEDRAARVAALGALTATGLHSCLDFGLTMPANALALVVICGTAAGVTRKKRQTSSTPPPLQSVPDHSRSDSSAVQDP